MQLHQLQSIGGRRRKRVGRGGKRGTTSGRGQKGQKSRAGRRIRPAQRDLIFRLPKNRGIANRPKMQKPLIFNLRDLSLKHKAAASPNVPLTLNKNFLKQTGLLPPDYSGRVKILGEGEISTPVNVEGLDVSKSAKDKIEKAGGRVVNSE
jgi:large subunit ribosomal protein L15